MGAKSRHRELYILSYILSLSVCVCVCAGVRVCVCPGAQCLSWLGGLVLERAWTPGAALRVVGDSRSTPLSPT